MYKETVSSPQPKGRTRIENWKRENGKVKNIYGKPEKTDTEPGNTKKHDQRPATARVRERLSARCRQLYDQRHYYPDVLK